MAQLLYIFLGFIVSTLAHQCTFNTTNGYYYDLFTIRELGDLYITTVKGTHYYQACSEVISKCGTSQSSVCLQATESFISEGTTQSAQWFERADKEDEGFVIQYSNGDICGTNGERRNTTVNWICSFSAEFNFNTFSAIKDIKDSDYCNTIITVSSPLACAIREESTDFDRPKEDRSLIVYLFQISLPTFGLLISLFICTCIKIRRDRKLLKIRQGMQHPISSKKSYEIMMEPFLQQQQQQQPHLQTMPHFVYVQMPMQGTDQHQPPYFAPQPFFLAPQYIQPRADHTQL